MTTEHGIQLDLVDAVDLIGALDFIADWLTTDRHQLEASLKRFATDHYSIDHLHQDLVRLAEVVGHARGVAIDNMGVSP